MITPRRTRLVRVPDLHGFRRVITTLSLSADADAASRIVLVPNRGAAHQFGRTIGTVRVPVVATREGLYEQLHARLDRQPRRLTPYERDVIMRAAAHDAMAGIPGQHRRLRPGYVAEMLRFYDQLRRQAQNVGRFEELLDDALLRDADHDRGAERMLAQTRLLAATFHAYERRVKASAAYDEHGLREALIATPSPNPFREIIVTVGDWIADPAGLYLADFDLLTRLPGAERIDVVATTTLLESGFHERIHEWLPGIEEVEAARGAEGPVRPKLCVPVDDTGLSVFVRRDREEELIAIAQHLTGEAVQSPDGVAVVFKGPLPYLYLAREVFRDAGLPYQSADALPLAAEPFAAALDLVFEFVESGFTRAATVALLRSPHFTFRDGAQPSWSDAVASLDRALCDQRYLGTLARLAEIDAAWPDAKDDEARAALQVARAAAAALSPLLTAGPASAQFACLLSFLDGHERTNDEAAGPEASRLRRGRAAVRDVLIGLAAAHASHDDVPLEISELAAAVRRWIEEHTFAPDSPGHGVQLVDDQAARYGAFDEVAVVGLIEGEWPDRPRRNIFYPASLLASLGWPTEKDRRAAAEARFVELLQSPSRLVMLSTISLDDDTLVEPSTFLEEIPRARLSTIALASLAAADGSGGGAAGWLALRVGRSPHTDAEFHGQTQPLAGRAWSVSALETYLGCPFKFFAQYVMRLEEEPEDEEVMDPRSQGQFMHDVFQAFFDRWQREGHQAITPDTLEIARAVFADVVEASIARLSPTEAALERSRLLGSPAAAGLGEAVLRMEAERPVPVVGRLLEHRLKGDFTFDTADGARSVPVNGKADRIDLLADGTFRLIDYKLGWPPHRGRALQLPVYGLCAEQSLAGHRGRNWTLGEASYLAFKGPKRVVGLFGSPADRERVLAEAQQRLVDTIDAVAAGHFPPTPDDVYRCETCTYAVVCRKDYVGDV